VPPRRRCPRFNVPLGARPAVRRFPQQTVNRKPSPCEARTLQLLIVFQPASAESLQRTTTTPLDPARPVSDRSDTLRRRRQRNALDRRSFFHQFPNEAPTTSPRGFSSPPNHPATDRASRPDHRAGHVDPSNCLSADETTTTKNSQRALGTARRGFATRTSPVLLGRLATHLEL
jgi:hypothetical protein